MLDYEAPKALLEGKTVLVTGAGDGIGKEAALQYAAHGATVILLGRTPKKLEDVYDLIEEQGYPQPAIVPINLENANEHDYQELANTLSTEFPQLDGLLLNASVLGTRTPLSDYDSETFEQVMKVNVNSQFMLTQSLIPLLRNSNSASIIFTTSTVGRKARAFWGAYSISKFATEAMMQLFSEELAQTSNIRVNAINPGATRTNMRACAYPAEDPQTLKSPEELMPLYLYLMGKDSESTNGCSVDAQPKN
ncbi:YciK family oxidoreductase [Marinomonas mediterranea]|jgi:Dehydrogenases with different specificities (related to short-chain alcohol dehydrogenases)|uniref:Short-chain dehydrogenase/reductase SDR n=1 Tax=Marinomonas mediterranea (strain ATCC 700492 / JCM 21426 / NBRC 103028 / MMB-1) TaxID=717774 RepID=F2JXC2_MARM1|nr:YciK family oxidoreductase [Marinomonas mediterranea]ADZ90728.1 short-chain dehydrogenase/reductase SDR [Marinomonas mediterranea MMB-1]WCN16887.1 YciK family oxidoreductase [Marinomonas mediterranea MMB-1]